MSMHFNFPDFFLVIIPLVVAVVAHEVAHGYSALRFGDTTARDAGRLSLNPIRHLDLFGSFLLPLTLQLSGAPFLFGYAKPVPVNFANLRPFKSGTLMVASAGVIVNFGLALLSATLFRICIRFQDTLQALFPEMVTLVILKLLIYSVTINVVLAVFNLIPILPLDGGRIVTALLPIRFQIKLISLERFGFVILILLLLTNSLDFLMTFFITPLANWLLLAYNQPY